MACAASNNSECLKDLDFWTFYSSLCMVNKICPLRSVIRHLKGTELCCPVEAIRSEHWKFLLEALSINNNLTKVHLRSDAKHTKDFIEPLVSKQRKRKSEKGFPTPFALQARNLSEICRSLSSCLKLSRSLSVLKLECLPLKLEDVDLLSSGLKKAKLNELSFCRCHLSDECVEIICEGLKTSLVEWVDFTSCNLNIGGVKHISELIKFHSNRRRSETWPDTLRYRFPVLDNLKGLNRVSMNDNAGLDDDAAKVLADCLMDDLWIKALDLQRCNITDEGASMLLQVLTYNCVLEVLDLQWNFISDDIQQRVSVQLELNNTGKTLKYEKIPLKSDESRKVKKMPRHSTALKIKLTKKNVVRIRPVKSTISKRFPVKASSFVSMKCDKATSTENNLLLSQSTLPTDCPNGHNNTLIQKYLACLAHSKKQQQHLVKKLKALTLENLFLRDALHKQAIPDGMILIDNETYTSVKVTFEKLESFLSAMKENGWASLREVDPDAIRCFIFDHPIKSGDSPDLFTHGSECMTQEESIELKPDHSEPCNVSPQANPVRVKRQLAATPDPRIDICTCDESANHQDFCHNTKASIAGRSSSTEGEKLKNTSNGKNLPVRPLDRTLVRKIFECMQRIHKSPNGSEGNNGKPVCSAELPKKFVVQTVRPKPNTDGHIIKRVAKPRIRPESSECIHHHKQLAMNNLKEAVDSQPSQDSRCSKSSIDHVHSIASDSAKNNVSENSSDGGRRAREIVKKVQLHKNSMELQDDSSSTLSKDRKNKADTASQSLPSMTFDNSLLANEFKKLSLTKDSSKHSGSHGEQVTSSKSKEDLSSSNQSYSSKSATKSRNASGQTSAASRKVESCISENSSGKSLSSSKSKSIYTVASSNDGHSGKDAKSYLESVCSDELTDKDLKSLPQEIEGSGAKRRQTFESPIKDKNVAAIMSLLSATASDSNSDTSISDDSEPELSKLHSNKVPEKVLTEKVRKESNPKLKSDLDDITIPSLSDITTVTSRSINSLMYELSESDKV